MGFTRYYTVNGKIDPEKFKSYSKDCKIICDYITEKYGIEIADWDGNGEPVFSDRQVTFNGKGEDDSHETFSLETTSKGFNFTKTNLKPYDKHVYACLFLAKYYFDHIVVTGDGENDDYPELTPIIKSILRDNKINIVIND